MLETVQEKISFPEEEEKILKFWNEINAFAEAQKLSKGRPAYSFYDGPPFATGLPHYGHILAGTIKDIVTRYAYQNGFHVERRFGWDCHGLPVEYEIDKRHGFKGPEDIEKLGVANYNKLCRDIVMQYSQQWEFIVNRIGRWIDFRNDYKTMYPSFMESVWWVFSELWNKGLVYRGVKVMPYSTACCTPLSNFESGQNYKDVIDPAVVIKFRSANDPNLYFLAWTTTPWTLPSNLALCVNPSMIYAKLKEQSTGNVYIMMESRIESFLKKESETLYSTRTEIYEVVEKLKGEVLSGLKYIPLFPYFQKLANCFVILTDNYVTSESGTGVVHQAPYFGEDDLRICLQHGVVSKDQEPVCPVNSVGHFVAPVSHFEGKYVKDADKDIIKHLKNENKLFNLGSVNHKYPYCWRSETPLIYRAIPSWFIRVEHMTKNLLEANDSTYWVPEFVKEKRFANWLRDARDWAISRNRYWGTPIPIWASEDFKEIVCVGSIAELERLTGTKVTDLHRESVDHLTIPSRNPNNPPLRRVPEVFDCWFESGSMPYAQIHYPFENYHQFNQQFPADFIAEGVDQTRGWFYTMLVVSTALFNKAPFKNLIVNGLVLAADGQKMSKSKKNFPDPMELINKYGADALRLYLIDSPVVRADKLRFREEGVRDVLKNVFLPWYNAYRFFVQNVEIMNSIHKEINLTFDDERFTPTNLMDKWILSCLQSLNVFVRKEMAAYRLYTVIPRLVKFIDDLTNWYVRMNRKRLKGDSTLEDCKSALSCLGSVLSTMIRLMAPFSPFLTELMYKNLNVFTKRQEKSIHFVPMPQPRMELINVLIERSVSALQTVIDLGRVIRDRRTIPFKCPLKEAVVILKSQEDIQSLRELEKYIHEELNVKLVTFSLDKDKYGLTLKVEPDHKTLGPRLKSKAKKITDILKSLTEPEIKNLQKDGQIQIEDEIILSNEVNISLKFTTDDQKKEIYETNFANDILLLMDISLDDSMKSEGIARELISRVQKLRKKAGLVPTDEIDVYLTAENRDSDLQKIIVAYKEFIGNSLKVKLFIEEPKQSLTMIIQDVQKGIEDSNIKIFITKIGKIVDSPQARPNCRFLNISLWGIQPGINVKSTFGTILLENP
uniref:Isoleucine--tRNA ligase, cytoplasmic n=1 Tax=Rhodnius prolixus TaxID=13249 RepID=T1HR91_RHOPR